MDGTPQLTRFFRNSGHFKLIEYLILPDLLNRAERRTTLELWSAGCSTGEEAYSAAILLSELLPGGFDYRIHATDRSPRAIEVARRGLYPPEALADVPPRLRERSFARVGSLYRVADRLRAAIRFEVASIESQGSGAGFDLVLCRNVLTYVAPEAQAGFLQVLWRAMRPKAYLVIGGSESLLGLPARFSYLESRWGSYYRKA